MVGKRKVEIEHGTHMESDAHIEKKRKEEPDC
jgi:hypothetical protein